MINEAMKLLDVEKHINRYIGEKKEETYKEIYSFVERIYPYTPQKN